MLSSPRLQRKQIMEELENRELTFTPQLNRASLLLQEKMRREGRSTYCKDSGQTHTRHKNGKVSWGTFPIRYLGHHPAF